MKNITEFIIFAFMILGIYFTLPEPQTSWIVYNNKNDGFNFKKDETIYREPTEYIQKKNDKKLFKQNRKEWIENMHQSHPDDNWKEIDKNNRRINTNNIRTL